MLNQNGSPNYGPRDWLMGSVDEGWHRRTLQKCAFILKERTCVSVSVCVLIEE